MRSRLLPPRFFVSEQLLVAAGLSAIAGCSGDGPPPGEVIEIETIEIIEPDAPVADEPAETSSPPPPEPSADAST